ncbi:MAG: FctA domain-containing protein, partial [Coriobacteriia bacterium]|nr:FctA domain-containing protein [Coriobacteriia bacterium]
MSFKNKALSVFIAMMLAVVGFCVAPTTALADKGDTPAHSKSIENNEDGTYKLALSVTGDADTEVETAANVNVLIVYDVSQSMTNNAAGGGTRADNAEDVVHKFIDNLAGYQKTDDPSTTEDESANIQMALVSFGPMASINSEWTSDLSDSTGLNRYFDEGTGEARNAYDPTGTFNYSSNLGTNWDYALQQARAVLGRADSDPTFVIFVTDGVCTKSGTASGNGEAPTNSNWTHYRDYYAAAATQAEAIQSMSNVTMFGIYAYGTEHDLLDDLMYYANTGEHREMTVGGTTRNVMTVPTNQNNTYNFGATTEGTTNYYNAGNTAALNAAIADIFQQIVEALGVSSVAISDGTTNQVQTSTGVAELLEVDESSYQYWLTIPIDGNNQFQRIDLVSGDPVTYTVSSDGKRVTWGTSNSVTVNGEIITEGGQKYLKYEWTEANALYNVDPPEAKLVDGAVDWDLSDAGTLLDGVTYTVTFDVYPSQTTYDIIAKLDNGDLKYSELDAGIRQYLEEDGDLKTNTTANLTWTDTREDNPEQHSSAYNNLDPVPTEASEMSVTKGWENALDAREVEEIDMTVLMNGEAFHEVTLSENTTPKWTENPIYISTGLMRTQTDEQGQEYMQILDTGHDFTFAELGAEQFNWELVTPVMHPMIIDGTLTMLILIDDDHPNSTGAQTYTLDEKEYYVAGTGEAALSAYNYRRSNLNIKKVVDGEDADPDTTFPFTLTVNNSKADDPQSTDTNSDNYVWFSIYDTVKNQTVMDANVTAEGEITGPSSSGYYYVKSGTTIHVDMKAGWNLRFTNLPTETTYEFEEGTLPDNFAYDSTTLKATYGSGDEAVVTEGKDADKTFSDGQTTTGTIQSTNTTYEVNFTNKYGLTDIEITKVWEDNDDQDGVRPTADEFVSWLTLKCGNDDVTEANASKLVVTDNEDGTYTAKWSKLNRYEDGEELTYSVTETPSDDYVADKTTVDDHGVITNTHTPEETQVTIVKVWDDSDNIGNIRPGSIQAQLKADGSNEGAAVTLDDGNKWTYTWTKLPKYKKGVEIAYTADETAVPAGYSKTGPVKETADDGSITFTVTNTYNPTPVTVDPSVQKIIENNDGLYNKGDFTFTIENTSAPEGITAPMPANTSTTNSADNEVEGKTGYYNFGTITFTMPGTYVYTVKESGSVDGVTNDPAGEEGKTLTFTVTDDGTGTLVVSPTTADASISFTNTYDANGEATIVVNKALEGAAWPEGKTLTFTLEGSNAPMPETTTATLDAIGSVTFGPIAYKLADAGKSYTYTISEDGFGDGWTGSPDSITATVAVTDNGDGTLSAEVSYDPTNATITNTYEAEGEATIDVIKALQGAGWPEGKELTFTLSGTNVPMPETTTAKLSSVGKASFGPIAYTEADAGKSYTYTISEDGFGDGWTASGSVTATVEVTDNGDGTLSTKVSYDPTTDSIVNTYEAEGEAVLKVKKAIE